MAYGSKKQSTVIVGAGIIGLSTAYYLSLTLDVDNHAIHVVENSDEFFASASGKAGGFLAEDCTWHIFPSLDPWSIVLFLLVTNLSKYSVCPCPSTYL